MVKTINNTYLKKNINTRHNLNIMRRLSNMSLTIFFILLASMFSVMSINAVVTYDIDEGFGGVIFDSSNAGQSGVVVNKPKNVNWVTRSVHGVYSLGFIAGKDDYIQIPSYPQLTPALGNFTIELDYLPTTTLGITQTVFDKPGSYTFSITPTINPIAPAIKIPDGTLTLTIGGLPIIIPINNITFGQLNSLFITHNSTNYDIYNGGVKQNALPILNALPITATPLIPLTLFDDSLGTGFNTGCQGIMPPGSVCSFDGLIDEFEIFDFYLNASQVVTFAHTGNLVNNGNVIEGNNGGTIFNQLVQNISSPINGQTFLQNLNINFNLNEVSTCNLYVNNNFKKTYNNVLAINDLISFNNDFGNHSMFLNCFNQNFNEITPLINFNVSKNPNTQITFDFNGVDFLTNDYPLELVTPCLKEGMTFAGAVPGYRPLYNTGGAQFKDIKNGIATMTLPIGTYEFCLINGRITYSTYNHTNQWNPNEIIKQIELGKFDLPNNLTTTYSISLEKFDMFDKTNPKAWNTSWVAIISSLLAFLLGLLILAGGIMAKNGQAVVIGGLLLLASLGFQVTNLVLGVLM